MSAVLERPRTAEAAVLELAYRAYKANRRNPAGEERQLWALAEAFGDEVVVECEARMWLDVYRKRDDGQGDPVAEAAEWLRASASVWLQAAAMAVRGPVETQEQLRLSRERCRKNAALFSAAARRLEEQRP